MSDLEEQSINLPQIIALVLIGFFALRWYLSTNTTTAPGAASGRAATSRSGAANNEAAIDQIQQMFPQIDRRTIMWEMQRNGNSAARVIERALSGRSLETPPQSFQPNIPPATPSSRPAAAQQPAASRPSHPDLISRYNLQSKIGTPPVEGGEAASQQQKGGWTQSKVERQQLLARRKEEMILAARRKMEEKERAGKA